MSQSYPAPTPQHQPPAPPKKSRTWIWVVGLLVLFLVVIPLIVLGGCAALLGGAASSVEESANKVHSVEYKVTSTLPVKIHYGATNGSSEDDSSEKTWTKTEQVKGDNFPMISITPLDFDKKGTVTCEIKVDGKVLSTKTAKGTYPSPTCEATSWEVPTAGETSN